MSGSCGWPGGALYELQTQMEIALNLGYVGKTTFDDFENAGNEIARMLSALIRTLEDGKEVDRKSKLRSGR